MNRPLFRRVLIHNGRARKTYFVCKCLVPAEASITETNLQEGLKPTGQLEQFCHTKFSSFKGMLRHLIKKHRVYLPNTIICESCQEILQNDCQMIDHFIQHIKRGLEAFNYEHENEFNCESCITNKNLVKMIRAGVSCQL